MGELRAALAMSHAVGLTAFPERADPVQAASVFTALDELQRRLAAAEPEAVIGVSVEHFTNFSFDNLPTFSVCGGAQFAGPANEGMAELLNLAPRTFAGHPALARALQERLLGSDFDPAWVEAELGFDENFSVPFHFLMPDNPVPVVPVILNAVAAPYPTLGRCFALGQVLAAAVASQTVAERVVMVATGGLSHSVGTAEAGHIDQVLDRRILDALGRGAGSELVELGDDELDAAGNGAHELRAWLVLAGAIDPQPVEVLTYHAVPGWLTGIAAAAWSGDGRQEAATRTRRSHDD